MFRRIPLTSKMLLVTIIVGITAWVVLDYIQTRSLSNIFHAQLNEKLSKQAEENRLIFDRYVKAHSQTTKIIILQKRFDDYIEEIKKKEWLSVPNNRVRIKYYRGPPPWLPKPSILRSLVSFRYALLLDDRGQVREVYQNWPEFPPQSLLRPTNILRQLSHNQSLMTNIDGAPFLITSESVLNSNKELRATLMIASPLDNDFLLASQRTPHEDNIVALVRNEKNRIIASSRPDLLPAGTTLESLQDRYRVTGKSFFDYGASDLQMQFASLISVAEYESLSKSLLSKERHNRSITAFALILSFSFIMFWITKRVRKITNHILHLSENTLGIQPVEFQKGDELHTLEESFHNFTNEIISSRESLIKEKLHLEAVQKELEEKNRELDENGRKLQLAVDEISSLIQQAADNKGFDVRYTNPNLKKCYEVMKCTRKDCPCYGQDPARCWQINATTCHEDEKEVFTGDHGRCFECPVFKEATSDPIYQIGEQFNNMMHILELRNKELVKAYKDLKSTQSQLLQQEKMASIGQLAAGVAHEINNPMGFISSNLGTLGKYANKLLEFINTQTGIVESLKSTETLEVLKDKRKKLKLDYIVEDLEELIKESLEGAERVKNIVQNLKSFSRVDQAEHKPADINECIESTLNIIWNELKYKTTVKKEYGELPLTTCYPQQLNQVFMNLLVNAAQAIEKQGEIIIKTWNGDGTINVSISDTGCGIPEGKLGRIFDPFFTTKDVGKGTGLGLSISYDIVKKHNGEITVESEVGRGTAFNIKIPIIKGK